MAKGKGSYIKLDRGICNNWVWGEKPFSPGQAWVDLLLMAAWKTEPRNWKGAFIKQYRGEVFTSIVALADRWGWNRKKVRRFLAILESDGMCTLNSLPKGTLVTIENYAKYQGRGPADGTPKGAAEGQQRDTIEERIKKGKETRARECDPEAVDSAQREDDEELARLLGYESVEELERRRA